MVIEEKSKRNWETARRDIDVNPSLSILTGTPRSLAVPSVSSFSDRGQVERRELGSFGRLRRLLVVGVLHLPIMGR